MLLAALEIAINRALSHDIGAQQKMPQLHNHTLALSISPLPNTLYCTAVQKQLHLSEQEPVNVAVQISTSVPTLIKLASSNAKSKVLRPGDLSISGDPVLGQQFAQIFIDLDIQWALILSDYVDEPVANKLYEAAKVLRSAAQYGTQKLQNSLRDYLHPTLAVNAEQVMCFLDEVDTLRTKAEHVSLRVQQLQKRINE